MPPNPSIPAPGGNEIIAFDDQPKTEEELRASRASALLSAKNRMSTMTIAEANRLAYKDMQMKYYLLGTFGFYIVLVVGAIFIPSVTLVIDFAGAFAISALSAIFPSLFYLNAHKKFKKGVNFYISMAYVYFVIGCINCILGITSTIWGILSGSHGGH